MRAVRAGRQARRHVRNHSGLDHVKGVPGMQGTVTVTPAGAATIHTYTAPENGWRANSHVIELASQVVLFDAPLTEEYARDVLAVASGTGKPVSRLYLSHA